MQLFISFPDSGFPDFQFHATTESIVKEAVEAAAAEWVVDAALLELSFSGVLLSSSSLLVSHGVEGDSKLSVSLLKLFRKELLTDPTTRTQIGKVIGKRVLRLDTPTFTDDDGVLDFKNDWIPDGVLSICFDNPNSSITAVASNFLEGSAVTNVDLLGLRHVSLLGSSFLRKSAIKNLDLSPLSSLKATGFAFLGRLTMESVDLSPLCSLTAIDGSFMSGSSVKEVKVRSLHNLRSIGSSFLCSTSVDKLEVSELTNLRNIGNSFLASSSVGTFSFTNLPNLAYIGDSFLGGAAVVGVNLASLNSLTSVGSSFLSCLSIQTLSLDGGKLQGEIAHQKEYICKIVDRRRQSSTEDT